MLWSSALTGFSTNGLLTLVLPTRRNSSVSSNSSSRDAKGASDSTPPSRLTHTCRGTGMPACISVLYTVRRSSSRCCIDTSFTTYAGLTRATYASALARGKPSE